jgi:uncharacterized protein YbbK (DUF523 family)
MQEFFINKNSLNPTLRMELISDGHFDYKKNITYNHSIQNADVTFSMVNTSNNILKVSKAKAEILISSNVSCEDKYILQYNWKQRDVNECGIFKGWFEIKFHGDLTEEGINHPTGNLIVPVKDELIIQIK